MEIPPDGSMVICMISMIPKGPTPQSAMHMPDSQCRNGQRVGCIKPVSKPVVSAGSVSGAAEQRALYEYVVGPRTTLLAPPTGHGFSVEPFWFSCASVSDPERQ